MPKAFKRNAVIVLALVVFFGWAFMFAKHDPDLRYIIPFGQDPYDAVGSFGVIAGILIAMVSLVQAFRPYRKGPPTTAQRVYLVRSQESVILAVLITLTADTVALARHPLTWIYAASSVELFALLVGLGIVAVTVQLLICASQRYLPETVAAPWKPALAATVLAVAILAVYPEKLIERLIPHLLTVLVGACILFAPMRFLLTLLVPYRQEESAEARPARSMSSTAWHGWGIVVIVGIMVGTVAFLGEMSEGGGVLPVPRLLFVAVVFISLGLGGLLIAYGFLGNVLGLGRR